jgi:dTDP-L-rhamnose 4-epimerase
MRILVTGGAGFIGSHIVDALSADGHEVRVLDSLVAHDAHPDYLHPGVELIEEDIRDPRATARAIQGVDAVCHQASMVGLGVDISDISAYVANNDLGTAVLLEELAEAGFEGRFVLASSMVVYGEGSYACPACGIAPPAPPRRTFRPALPRLWHRTRASLDLRGCAARPAQRVRRDQAPPGAPVLRVRP